jgi:hypothetical protein
MAKSEGWAVYWMPMKAGEEPVRAICAQAEWEAMDRAKPGYYTLIQGNMPSEGQAERLARGKSGETPPRGTKAATERPAT